MPQSPAAEHTKASGSVRARPLSPHLQVWRWHVTMLGSILHRASGVGLYVGAFMAVAWLAALAAGPETYARFVAFAASPIGLVLWLGFSAAAFYHLAAGVRHLLWDWGQAVNVKSANLLSWLSIVFAVVATALFWIGLFVSGSVSL